MGSGKARLPWAAEEPQKNCDQTGFGNGTSLEVAEMLTNARSTVEERRFSAA